MDSKIRELVKQMREMQIIRITYETDARRLEDQVIEVWFKGKLGDRHVRVYQPTELDD